jgi:hypothetical protein
LVARHLTEGGGGFTPARGQSLPSGIFLVHFLDLEIEPGGHSSRVLDWSQIVPALQQRPTLSQSRCPGADLHQGCVLIVSLKSARLDAQCDQRQDFRECIELLVPALEIEQVLQHFSIQPNVRERPVLLRRFRIKGPREVNEPVARGIR